MGLPFTEDLAGFADLPAVLPPGGALFIQAATPVELMPPDPLAQILYYHQDHLGSSSAVTDSQGNLVEETAHYPFGAPRHQHLCGKVDSYYGFTQKEQDPESGLHYFEARYMASNLSRFLSADPLYLIPDAIPPETLGRFLTNSQMLNLYAYALNNPLKYTDPSGLDAASDIEKIDNANDLRDAAFTLVELVAKEDGLISDTAKGFGKVATPIGPLIDGIALLQNPSSRTASDFSSTVGITAASVVNPAIGLAVLASKLVGGPDIQKGLHDLGTAIGGALAEPSALAEVVEKWEIQQMTHAKFAKMRDRHVLDAMDNPGAFRGNHPLPGSAAKQPQPGRTSIHSMDNAASRIATEWNKSLRSQTSN